jgi:hypothetical protein
MNMGTVHDIPVKQPRHESDIMCFRGAWWTLLAGSERASRSGAAGVRFKETININQVCLSNSATGFHA